MIKVDELKLGTYDTEHRSITNKLGELEEHKTTANGIMAKGTWQGDAYNACKGVLSVVDQYLANFSADYMQFNTDINELVSNVDSFVNDSTAVGKLS